MSKISKSDKAVVFLSWSGSKSKEVAIVLKTFIANIFHLSEDEVYFSEKDSHGQWFIAICQSISKSAIFIPCITKENTNSPWIYFETGVGSYLKPNILQKCITPVLFDMTIKDFTNCPTFISRHVMIDCKTTVELEKAYELMLKRLIHEICIYIKDNTKRLNKEFGKSFNDELLKELSDIEKSQKYPIPIKKAVQRLMVIKNKYDTDIFISRPIKGLDGIDARQLEELISESIKGSPFRIFYAGKEVDFGKSIASYRIEIIKQCHSFVLIYPRNKESNPPSSCLIELGVALAVNKRIIILVEKDAIVPKFFEDLKETISRYSEYSKLSDLRSLLEDIVNLRNNLEVV